MLKIKTVMSKNKTTVLGEAVIEAQQIMEAAKKHMKEMLFSELEPDFDKLVNESVEKKEDKPTDVKETETPVTENIGEDDKEDEENTDVVSGDNSDDVVSVDNGEEASSDEESPMADAMSALDSEDSEDEVSVDLGDNSEESPLDSMESPDDMNNLDAPEGDDTVDLTGAPIEDVVKVFKEITPEDQIEVVKDENGINLNVKGEKFYVKLNENETLAEEEDELIYEIELDDEEEEEQVDEASRTHSDGHRKIGKPVGFYNYAKSRIGSASNVNESEVKDLQEKLKLAETEKAQLAESNKVYKNTLDEVKQSLISMGLFNNNLGHAIKLFMEHSTTKDEKKEIITRFNSVNNVTESKSLFENISNELKNKKTITESVAEKLDSTLLGASSDKTLVKGANDAVLTRMQELMNYKNKEN